MTRPTRLARPLAALALALAAGLRPRPPALRPGAEPPADGEGEGSGRPLDGYLATGCLAGLALFIVCKSARRS